MTTTIKIADKAINTTYQDKTGTTSGTGTGAKFDITKENGVYTVALDSAVASAGSGYAAGDTITILGSQLGGVGGTNNVIITVATVGAGGKIATIGAVGTGQVGDGVVDVQVDVTGTAGVDTYTIAGNKADFTITKNAHDITLDSTLATNVEFKLADHERVSFTDTSVAFDLVGGKAGFVYSLLGAGLGISDISKEFMGAGIYLKDLGWTDKQVAQALLNTTVYKEDAGGVSDETFVKHVWKNIFGTDATLANVTEVTTIMKTYGYDQADILLVAAKHATFQTTVDLVGLQTTGVEYTPYAG
jgi:serralysin